MKTGWMSLGMALVMTTAFAQNQGGAPSEKMREHRAKMEEMHQKLTAEWKAEDAELDKLLADVKSAPADKKADSLTAVVSKLVDLRKTDHQRLENFHKMMKEKWQARHGESGAKPGESASPKPSL